MMNPICRGLLLVLLAAMSPDIAWSEESVDQVAQKRPEKKVDLYLSEIGRAHV